MHRASVPFSILVLFCVLGVALADSPPDRSDRGMTGEPSPLQPSPGPAIDGTNRTVAVPRGAPRPESDGRTEVTTDPAWELIVEEPVWQRIDVGERFAVQFEMSSETLTPLGAKVHLIPGDPFTALSRVANGLVGVDLLVIGADQDRESLAWAWFYVPRMLHERSLVCLEEFDRRRGRRGYKLLSLSEVESLAAATHGVWRGAA